MTTAISQNGAVILPAAIRERLKLAPGDDLEIDVEDEGTIILRRVRPRLNEGLIDHILSCPGPLPPMDVANEDREDRASKIAAMDEFLDEFTGVLEVPSEDDLAGDPRLAYLMKKHAK
jgi:AbrB family looped-hinge helix DNA binding protein